MMHFTQNSDCYPSRTVHIDSFLYSDEDVNQLCDEGKLSRFYCMECGSHNTRPLSKLSSVMLICFSEFAVCNSFVQFSLKRMSSAEVDERSASQL